jgi:hypothetical protein
VQLQVTPQKLGQPQSLIYITHHSSMDEQNRGVLSGNDEEQDMLQTIRVDDEDDNPNPTNNLRRDEQDAAQGLLQGAQRPHFNEKENTTDDDETEECDA